MSEIYVGCLVKSYAKAYTHREYSHTDERGVEYYHCWRKDPDYVAPLFGENEEPNPKKIKAIQTWLFFFGVIIATIIYFNI